MITMFQNIIPSMSPDEFAQLEANILEDGIRDPLVKWGDVLIDGHNRYKIALKHGLEYKTVQTDFEDEDAAKAWIIMNQFGRRNISDVQRAKLALELQPLLSKRAKERKQATLKQNSDVPMLAPRKAGKTRDELAKMAGIGHTSLEKVSYIQRYGTDEIKEKLDSGELSINKAHLAVVSTLPPKKRGRPTTQNQAKEYSAEKACTCCGRILPVSKFSPRGDGTKSWCRECDTMRKKGGNSPNIKSNIQMIGEIVSTLTDIDRPVVYTIEDLVMTITESTNSYISVLNTEFNHHRNLMEDPVNNEAVVKAIAHGADLVRQLITKINELAR